MWIRNAIQALKERASSVQAKAGTSTSLVPSAASMMDAILSPQVKRNFSPTTGGWTKLTSGSATGSINDYGVVLTAPSSVQTPGYVLYHNRPHNDIAVCRGKTRGVIDWSKRMGIGGTICVSATLDAQNVFRMSMGKIATTDLAGDLPSGRKGIGIKITSTGKVELMVGSGTGAPTITTTSTFTLTLAQAFDVWIDSDGAGNVYLYVNDQLVCSTTGGPTTDSSTTDNGFVVDLNTAGVPTVTGQMTVANFAQYIGR
jgi:hypothetical protein